MSLVLQAGLSLVDATLRPSDQAFLSTTRHEYQVAGPKAEKKKDLKSE